LFSPHEIGPVTGHGALRKLEKGLPVLLAGGYQCLVEGAWPPREANPIHRARLWCEAHQSKLVAAVA
jgi:hypothetical protein